MVVQWASFVDVQQINGRAQLRNGTQVVSELAVHETALRQAVARSLKRELLRLAPYRTARLRAPSPQCCSATTRLLPSGTVSTIPLRQPSIAA
jgi:hypothetical protein